MSGDKILVAKSIVKFLKSELSEGAHDEDCAESLSVAVQCIESAFNLPELRSDQTSAVEIPELAELIRQTRGDRPTSPSAVRAADAHKNRGNQLMQEDRPAEALIEYNRAIALHASNAVYFGNRAAAHSKLQQHLLALEDCRQAIAIDRTYGKAYGRMGLALSNLRRYAEAREAFVQAIELEPDNGSYRNNLQFTEDLLRKQHQQQQAAASVGARTTSAVGTSEEGGSSDAFAGPFSQMWTNPNLVSLATQILGSPDMRDMMEGVITNSNLLDSSNSLSAFVNAGQQLADEMQTTNPDLVDQIRRTIQEGATHATSPVRATMPTTPEPNDRDTTPSSDAKAPP